MTPIYALVPGLVLASALTAVTAAPGNARSAQCAPINKASIEMFFDQWDHALATGDPQRVASRYAPDALLLPTVSDRPRMGRAEIAAYFVEFLRGHPRSTVERRIIRLGCNEAFDAGHYTFMVDGETAGERVPIRARFSFVYEIRDGRWVITHHHSSRVPGSPDKHVYVEPWPGGGGATLPSPADRAQSTGATLANNQLR
jgi:uncharacterized protein (TIGR02246 family)